MKYGLFDLARMWVTKNGVSKDFYNPEVLRLFLDSFQHQPMDSATSTRPQDTSGDDSGIPPPEPERGGMERYDPDNCPRGRDLERLASSHDNRGQVLHAVALHTQLSERDKSRLPLKPVSIPPCDLIQCPYEIMTRASEHDRRQHDRRMSTCPDFAVAFSLLLTMILSISS
ncbi:hypothetical protein NDU88_004805 [Pleurodeles waltl]|uniref:Uncharacterized protein n=1 Tax=Pleurodeles waltl TaxID=8319 RepID=A0AAV7WWS4_PLEWA|nr:hypothetical protein NDU88_004805 [Pleurodeles waltl]